MFIFEQTTGALVDFKRIVSNEPEIRETFQHYFNVNQKAVFKVMIKSDSYIGFDVEKTIEIKFKP